MKLAPEEWEVAKRIATILYDGTVNDLFERAIVEKCIAAGVIPISRTKSLPMPRTADNIDTALRAAATFTSALASRLTDTRSSSKTWEKRIFFLRTKTRIHLAKQLAIFPAIEPFEPPAYRADGEPAPTVTKIRLRPMHMTAAKAAADALYGKNLSALVHRSLEDKAKALHMDKKGVAHPTFDAYPEPALFSLQRNVEEPALALIAALEDLAPRVPPKKSKATDELRAACDELFAALLSLLPPDA